MDQGQNANGGMAGGGFSQFGGGMSSAPQNFVPTISSGPGDINIGGEKKSRKWLVIVVIVLLLAAVVGGVFALWKSGAFGGGSGSSGSGGGGQVSNTQTAFNKYANYLLEGQESTNEITYFNVTDTYYIDENYNNTEYLDRLLSLRNDFVASASANDGLAFSSIDDEVELLKTYSAGSAIDLNTLSERYASGGADAAKTYIKDAYLVSEDESSFITMLHEYDVARNTARVEQWDYFNAMGCIVNGTSDQTCIENTSNGEVYKELVARLDDAETSYESIPRSIIRSLKNSCGNIIEIFKDDGNEE